MWDLHVICAKADEWARQFEAPEYIDLVATRSCEEVDRDVDLLIALDYHGLADAVTERHIEIGNCHPRRHTAAESAEPAAP